MDRTFLACFSSAKVSVLGPVTDSGSLTSDKSLVILLISNVTLGSPSTMWPLGSLCNENKTTLSIFNRIVNAECFHSYTYVHLSVYCVILYWIIYYISFSI